MRPTCSTYQESCISDQRTIKVISILASLRIINLCSISHLSETESVQALRILRTTLVRVTFDRILVAKGVFSAVVRTVHYRTKLPVPGWTFKWYVQNRLVSTDVNINTNVQPYLKHHSFNVTVVAKYKNVGSRTKTMLIGESKL